MARRKLWTLGTARVGGWSGLTTGRFCMDQKFFD
jgi:hypothetical protein